MAKNYKCCWYQSWGISAKTGKKERGTVYVYIKKMRCFYQFLPFLALTEAFCSFQEAQEKLMELDRLSNELDAFIEKTKHATIEESEVQIF